MFAVSPRSKRTERLRGEAQAIKWRAAAHLKVIESTMNGGLFRSIVRIKSNKRVLVNRA